MLSDLLTPIQVATLDVRFPDDLLAGPVVDTIGITDGQWGDRSGSPLTDAAKITERFRRIDFGHMEIELTVNDPKAYTKPWTVKLSQVIKLDTDLLDFFCADNEKDSSHLSSK